MLKSALQQPLFIGSSAGGTCKTDKYILKVSFLFVSVKYNPKEEATTFQELMLFLKLCFSVYLNTLPHKHLLFWVLCFYSLFMSSSVIYLMPVSLYSHPGSRINCVLTKQHWRQNSSIPGSECSIFLNICQRIPLNQQMQQYINVMNKLPGYPHPHLCAVELHCRPKAIKNTLLSLTTAPDDTDEHRLLFISVKLAILLGNSLWKPAMIPIWKCRFS